MSIETGKMSLGLAANCLSDNSYFPFGMEMISSPQIKGEKTELTKLEETQRQQQTELVRKEQALKDHMKTKGPSPELASELLSAQKNTEKLKRQVKKAQNDLKSPRKANVALAISTMNNLIGKIESEIERERNPTISNNSKNNLKIHQLEKETKVLHKEISQLLSLLTRNRIGESSAAFSQNYYSENASCTGTSKTVRFSTSEY